MTANTKYDEPVMQKIYYQLSYDGTANRFKMDYGAEKIGVLVEYHHVRQAYRDASGLWYNLKDGGRTKPAFVEETPIPCPKVRAGIETRYMNGGWEKLSKRQGWVPA